jgi:hypothetical protein
MSRIVGLLVSCIVISYFFCRIGGIVLALSLSWIPGSGHSGAGLKPLHRFNCCLVPIQSMLLADYMG